MKMRIQHWLQSVCLVVCLRFVNMATIFEQQDGEKGHRDMIHAGGGGSSYSRNEGSVTSYLFPVNDNALCGNDLFLVIVVCSAVQNFKARQAIRTTWGMSTDDVQVVFLLGQMAHDHPLEHQVQAEVLREHQNFHDTIQTNIIDDYRNLTLKSIAMLQWLNKDCSMVKYILKTDDDMFINVPLLINDLENTVHERFVMGHMIAAAHPIRDPKSKWYTPETVYRESMYPKYMSGTAYVISADLVSDLISATQEHPPFWLEDVYITGFCMEDVNGKHIYNGKFGYRPRVMDPCLFRIVITAHQLTPDDLYAIWEELDQDEYDCSETRISTGNL